MAYASLKRQENMFNKHVSMLRNSFFFLTVLQLEIEHERYNTWNVWGKHFTRADPTDRGLQCVCMGTGRAGNWEAG